MDHERGADVFRRFEQTTRWSPEATRRCSRRSKAVRSTRAFCFSRTCFWLRRKAVDSISSIRKTARSPSRATRRSSSRPATRSQRARSTTCSSLPEAQEIMRDGRMHAVDPRLAGPDDEPGLDVLLTRSRPWSEALLVRGTAEGPSSRRPFRRRSHSDAASAQRRCLARAGTARRLRGRSGAVARRAKSVGRSHRVVR